MLTYTIGTNGSALKRANVQSAMQAVFGHAWDVTPVGSSDFYMVIRSVPLGAMTLSQANVSQAQISNGVPSRSTPDRAYNIYASNRRHVVLTQGKRVVLAPGDVTVTDSATAVTMTTKEPYTTIGLTVPARLLRAHIPEPEKLVGVRFSSKAGLSKIVSYMLLMMWEYAGSDDFDEIGTELADNLLALLATSFHLSCRQPAIDDADASVKQEKIKQAINQNLRRPDLCVGELAKQFGLSVRYIQRLFSEEDCTISRYIRMQRLEGCKKQLADPALSSRSITEIAFNWGFNSSAHFARVFKETYGINAREYRKQALKRLDGRVIESAFRSVRSSGKEAR